MKQQLINFYLDYLNNYISAAKIAEHNGLDLLEANTLINMGRRYHEEYTDNLKARHDPAKSI